MFIWCHESHCIAWQRGRRLLQGFHFEHSCEEFLEVSCTVESGWSLRRFASRKKFTPEPTPAHTEPSGTFRNLPPEPAPATRTGTHRRLSGLKTPLAYAVGEKQKRLQNPHLQTNIFSPLDNSMLFLRLGAPISTGTIPIYKCMFLMAIAPQSVGPPYMPHNKIRTVQACHIAWPMCDCSVVCANGWQNETSKSIMVSCRVPISMFRCRFWRKPARMRLWRKVPRQIDICA